MAYSVPAQHKIKNGLILQDLDQLSSTAAHDIGYTVETDDGRRFEYAFISTNTTAAPAATYPAFYLQGGATRSVTTTYQSDYARSRAGILTCAVAAGSNYGWVQKSGYAASAYVSSGVSAGDTLTVADTGRFSEVLTTAVSDSVAGVTYANTNVGQMGVALEDASSGQADIMLNDD